MSGASETKHPAFIFDSPSAGVPGHVAECFGFQEFVRQREDDRIAVRKQVDSTGSLRSR